MNKIYKIICAVIASLAIVICFYVIFHSIRMNFTTTEDIVWTITLLGIAFGIMSLLKKHFKSARKNKFKDFVFEFLYWFPVLALTIYAVAYVCRVYL